MAGFFVLRISCRRTRCSRHRLGAAACQPLRRPEWAQTCKLLEENAGRIAALPRNRMIVHKPRSLSTWRRRRLSGEVIGAFGDQRSSDRQERDQQDGSRVRERDADPRVALATSRSSELSQSTGPRPTAAPANDDSTGLETPVRPPASLRVPRGRGIKKRRSNLSRSPTSADNSVLRHR